jgi:outer membrane protein assembly factor BamB
MLWLRSLLGVLLFVAVVPAADWPQWLGPHRNNTTSEIVAPWKEAPKVVWHVPVAEGNSAPVVVDGKIFLHTKINGKNQEQIEARDAKTGKELWRQTYDRPEFKSFYGNGPRSTPCVVDGKLYTLGITGLLSCLDTQDGKMLWQVDTLGKFKVKNLVFGVAGSPLIDRDLLYVNVGGDDASVVAFDRLKGDVVWKNLSDRASYSSPILVGKRDDQQLIFLTAAGLTSLAPGNGKLLWQFPLKDALLESSTTPVKVGDRLLASSITYGTACLKLESKDNKPSYKEEWKNPKLTSYFSTPVAVGTDHVYMVTGENPLAFKKKAEATLHCVEMATGKILWSKPKVGTYHAALLRTGDNKLLMLQDNGNLVLLDPDPKEYKELARSKVCGPTWAHPMLVDGKLYLRDEKELFCIDLSK